MLETIDVKYSCKGCGVKERDVAVRVREPSENVVQWVERASKRVSLDHGQHSPNCPAEVFDLKVPIDGRPEVGGPVKH